MRRGAFELLQYREARAPFFAISIQHPTNRNGDLGRRFPSRPLKRTINTVTLAPGTRYPPTRQTANNFHTLSAPAWRISR